MLKWSLVFWWPVSTVMRSFLCRSGLSCSIWIGSLKRRCFNSLFHILCNQHCLLIVRGLKYGSCFVWKALEKTSHQLCRCIIGCDLAHFMSASLDLIINIQSSCLFTCTVKIQLAKFPYKFHYYFHHRLVNRHPLFHNTNWKTQSFQDSWFFISVDRAWSGTGLFWFLFATLLSWCLST